MSEDEEIAGGGGKTWIALVAAAIGAVVVVAVVGRGGDEPSEKPSGDPGKTAVVAPDPKPPVGTPAPFEMKVEGAADAKSESGRPVYGRGGVVQLELEPQKALGDKPPSVQAYMAKDDGELQIVPHFDVLMEKSGRYVVSAPAEALFREDGGDWTLYVGMRAPGADVPPLQGKKFAEVADTEGLSWLQLALEYRPELTQNTASSTAAEVPPPVPAPEDGPPPEPAPE
jgi:hypothetical protein